MSLPLPRLYLYLRHTPHVTYTHARKLYSAVDRFYAQHNRYPGTSGGGSGKASEGEASSSLAADEEALWALLQAVAKEYGATGESMEEDGGVHAAVTQKHAREMARCVEGMGGWLASSLVVGNERAKAFCRGRLPAYAPDTAKP